MLSPSPLSSPNACGADAYSVFAAVPQAASAPSAPVSYTHLDVYKRQELLAEENVELAQRYRIMQAPTLLSVAADGSVDVIPGAAAVFQHVNAMKAQVTA